MSVKQALACYKLRRPNDIEAHFLVSVSSYCLEMISCKGHWHTSYGLTASLLGLLGFVLVQRVERVVGQGFYGLYEDDYPEEDIDEYFDDLVIDDRILNETLTGRVLFQFNLLFFGTD